MTTLLRLLLEARQSTHDTFPQNLTKWSQKWSKPRLLLNLFRKSKENGAPGMQPNLYKVVYYQWLIEVTFSKSGPR